MALSEQIKDIAHDAASRFPESPVQASAYAVGEVRKLPNFDNLIDEMVTQAVSTAVYEARHKITKRLKNDIGYYTRASERKQPASSSALNRVYRNVFNSYLIGGKTLGSITGAEIKPLIARIRSQVRGHEVNLRLLQWLDEKNLGPDVRVDSCMDAEVVGTQIARIIEEVRNECDG